MADLKILVWDHREPQGEPDVEVRIPAGMARWIPRMMKFVPKKNREEMWERTSTSTPSSPTSTR